MITIKVIAAVTILFSLNLAAAAAGPEKTGTEMPSEATAEGTPRKAPAARANEQSGIRG